MFMYGLYLRTYGINYMTDASQYDYILFVKSFVLTMILWPWFDQKDKVLHDIYF